MILWRNSGAKHPNFDEKSFSEASTERGYGPYVARNYERLGTAWFTCVSGVDSTIFCGDFIEILADCPQLSGMS